MNTDERWHDDTALPSLLSVGLSVPAPAHLLATRLEQMMMAAPAVLGVDGAGLMLRGDGHGLGVIGATDPTASTLAHTQAELLVGPSIDAFRRATAVSVTDLAAAEPYRTLWARVAGNGPRAVLSAPVSIRHTTVGSFDATLRGPHEWSPQEIRATQIYAGIVGVAVGFCARATYWDELSGRLHARLELAAGGGNRLD